MRVFAVDGVAGSGKTYRLLEELRRTIEATPLGASQRVLALTFMHGARGRLDVRLRETPGLGGRFECLTVDSFGWRLRRRWRSLGELLGLGAFKEADFDAECDAAGALLEQPEVQAWVATSFPIVLVDEAQDLSSHRLRMIRGISGAVTLLVASDEFQCLARDLLPNPFSAWIHTICEPESLVSVRRTGVSALLGAAAALRLGAAPVAGKGFVLQAVASEAMGAAYLANAIAWRKGGSVAVLVPSAKPGFARAVVSRVCAGPCGKNGSGPFRIQWERNEVSEAQELLVGLDLPETSSLEEAIQALGTLRSCGAVRQTQTWIRHRHRALGQMQFARLELEGALERHVAQQRHRATNDGYELSAMTVHQAKNREFDGVVVIWPYQVGGDNDQKRRLLYNAITRARRWCTVLIQGKELPKKAPFA